MVHPYNDSRIGTADILIERCFSMLEKTQYKNFEKMTSELLKVPRSEGKDKLKAEKAAKKRKKS